MFYSYTPYRRHIFISLWQHIIMILYNIGEVCGTDRTIHYFSYYSPRPKNDTRLFIALSSLFTLSFSLSLSLILSQTHTRIHTHTLSLSLSISHLYTRSYTSLSTLSNPLTIDPLSLFLAFILRIDKISGTGSVSSFFVARSSNQHLSFSRFNTRTTTVPRFIDSSSMNPKRIPLIKMRRARHTHTDRTCEPYPATNYDYRADNHGNNYDI